MKIAFLVSAHHLPGQLARLVSRIAVNGHAVYIHVDRKTDPRVFVEMQSRCRAYPGVRFASRRRKVYWADFTHVRAVLAGLADIAASDVPFDYVVMLSGQCYPLASMREIEEHLSALDGASEIECRPMPVPEWFNGMGNFENRHYRVYNRWVGARYEIDTPKQRLMRRVLPRRPSPAGLTPHKGLAFWALHRNAVTDLLRTLDERPEILRHFARTFLSDEMFFNTVVASSTLPYRNASTHYISFEPLDPHPVTLRLGDVAMLRASGKIFARKFDERVDSAVLDALDDFALEPA